MTTRLWFPPAPDGEIDASDRMALGIGVTRTAAGALPEPGVPGTIAQVEPTRTPVTLVEIDVDYCGRDFGIAPCFASGEPCFNTFPTCKARAAYQKTTRTLQYVTDGPLPWAGPRPYLQDVKLLPTEIKTNLTVTGRITIDMADEPDTDVGVDPYATKRRTFLRQNNALPAYPAFGSYNILNSLFPPGANRTLEVWFRTDRTGSGLKTIAASAGGMVIYAIDGRLATCGDGNEADPEILGPAIDDGKIHHAILRSAGKLTIDGTDYVTTRPPAATGYRNGHLFAGEEGAKRADNLDIFSLRYYLRSITDEEVEQALNAGPKAEIEIPDLEVEWLLTEGSGEWANDTGALTPPVQVPIWSAERRTEPVRTIRSNGSYWRKFYARNRNYKGRQVRVYAGWLGQAREAFVQKWEGKLDALKFGQGRVSIEAVDTLKDLSKYEIPAKVDVKLAIDIDAAANTATVTNPGELPAAPFVLRIDDELLACGAINTTNGVITGVARGYLGTVADDHARNAKVQPARIIQATNPFDLMKLVLEEAGIPSARIDTAAFDFWRDYPDRDLDVTAVITEPAKADKLFFELADLVDTKAWQGEDLKITCQRNIPNAPDREYATITDAGSIALATGKVDVNEKSRLSRFVLYWDKAPLAKDDDPASYQRLDIAVDADAEGDNEYGEIAEKKVFTRFLRAGDYVEEDINEFVMVLGMRAVFRQRDAQPLLTFEVEKKDDAIRTGAWLRVTTDEILDAYGNRLERAAFQVIKREVRGDRITLTAIQGCPRRICFIAEDDAPDYEAATDAEREYGYIADDEGLLPVGRDAYVIY